MEPEIPIEYELVKDVLALELKVLDTKVAEFEDNVRVRITLQDDPAILASCSFSLIYVLGALSFRDARPRGVSGMHLVERDDWTAADMLRHLRFERGQLHFYADYVRGRMMKTTVDVDPDGRVLLETVNRGEAAPRWVSTVQGKKTLAVVGDEPEPQPGV